MKILIINYRYFISGGPERYMFNVMDLLKSHGHEIVPFSIRYEKNLPSEYDKYFVPPLSSEKEIFFRDQSWHFTTFKRTLQRSFYSGEVYTNLKMLIEDTRPDVALVLHYLRKLSPSVLKALSDTKVPFAVRLSDYQMICPNAHLVRNEAVCELCVKGSKLNSVRYKCVQGSLGASVVNYAATSYHSLRGYYRLIPFFITPSVFLKTKMVEGGWNENKFVHIPTFVYPEAINFGKKIKDQVTYIGRIEKLKGVHVLLDAIRILKIKHKSTRQRFILAGDGSPEFVEFIHSYINKNDLRNVNYIGNVNKENVTDLLKESAVSISPSIWYENMPNSVLESFSCGTPVIASNHGSYTEIVRDGETGFLFQPGNAEDLAQKIFQSANDPKLLETMGKQAAEYVLRNHSPEKHYDALMQLFNKLVS